MHGKKGAETCMVEGVHGVGWRRWRGVYGGRGVWCGKKGARKRREGEKLQHSVRSEE